MPLKLNSTGGGSVTLDSGSTPNNVTITLPGVDGTMATLASVTNNGVVYVNSSGQPTSGSALTFDGTNLGIGTSSPASPLHIATASAELVRLQGTASAGFIRFANESNTSIAYVGRQNTNDLYLWNSTANSIRLGTNNVMAALIDASGNLGIGTSSPTGKLDVVGAAGIRVNEDGAGTKVLTIRSNWAGVDPAINVTTNNSLLLMTNNTERMRIDSSGNVGIGTSSPNRALTLYRASSPVLQLTDATTGTTANDGLLIQQVGVDTYIENAEIGFMQFRTSATERMRITSDGEVYIAGTTDRGAYNLQCNGTGVWGAGAYVNGSDQRLKEEIADIDSGLDVVSAMRPVTFRYKEDYSKDQSTQPGFIAQELQQALAGTNYVDGVVQAGPEYLNVAYQNLIPILTKAIQELKAELDELKAKVQA